MTADAGAAGAPEWMPADDVGTDCSGDAQLGTMALRTALLERFGGTDLGIYNCREVRGGGSLSVHAEGRAFDLGTGGRGREWGDGVLQALAQHARGLYVQRVIWHEHLYDAGSPYGRDYHGDDPHTSHLHIEQTWAGAWNLTTEAARRVLFGLPAPSEGHVLLLARFDDLQDTFRWLYVDGRRLRLHSWSTGPGPLSEAGVPTVHLSDTQLRTIPEV